MTRIIRYAVAAIAVVVCAWFALGARQAHEIDTASTTPDVARAASALTSAKFLYPGNDVRILQAQLDLKRRRYGDARRLLAKMIAAEPQNIFVWSVALDLAIDAPSTENAQMVTAHLRMLDPVEFRNR